MGNKLTRKRQVVDEKYTHPQGLYQHKDVDHKKLRKLILDSRLAPCYPGNEVCSFDLEECPICFLYYPSLNRSRCCMKGICTECFLRMKPPHSTRPTQCPFCKTSNYAVEYRGIRSKEEKGMEQVEEQRVIEAKIRMRQQELLDEEERMQQRQVLCRIMRQGEIECHDVASSSLAVPQSRIPMEGDDITSSQESRIAPTIRQSSWLRQNGEDEFDLDLEDIMVMEAIWLSIQETGCQRNPPQGNGAPSRPFVTEDHYVSSAMVSSADAPSGGLACAIAALAELQQINGDSSTSSNRSMPAFNMLSDSSSFSNEEERVARNYPPDSWIDASPNSGRAVSREEVEWGVDHGSETAEAGTSYASSDGTGEAGLAALQLPYDAGDRFQSNIPGPILPESFEEQMMLAMAVSLAEARARTNAQGVAWL